MLLFYIHLPNYLAEGYEIPSGSLCDFLQRILILCDKNKTPASAFKHQANFIKIISIVMDHLIIRKKLGSGTPIDDANYSIYIYFSLSRSSTESD